MLSVFTSHVHTYSFKCSPFYIINENLFASFKNCFCVLEIITFDKEKVFTKLNRFWPTYPPAAKQKLPCTSRGDIIYFIHIFFPINHLHPISPFKINP